MSKKVHSFVQLIKIMRNKEKISTRNIDMITMFHKLHNTDRLRFDDTLAKVAKQFYLEEDYTYKLIFYDKKNKDLYEQLSVDRK